MEYKSRPQYKLPTLNVDFHITQRGYLLQHLFVFALRSFGDSEYPMARDQREATVDMFDCMRVARLA